MNKKVLIGVGTAAVVIIVLIVVNLVSSTELASWDDGIVVDRFTEVQTVHNAQTKMNEAVTHYYLIVQFDSGRQITNQEVTRSQFLKNNVTYRVSYREGGILKNKYYTIRELR